MSKKRGAASRRLGPTRGGRDQETAAGEVVKLRDAIAGRAAPSSTDDAYDLRWARRVLAGEEAPPPEVVREELVHALIEELVARTEGAILTRLAASGQPGVAKAARTGLHRLRSHKIGVEIPAPAAAAAPAPRGTGLLEEEAPLRGLAGAYDHRGNRALWLPTLGAQRGILLHQARVSAAHGLIGFESYSSSRRKYKRLGDRLRGLIQIEELEAPVVHWLIEDAARRARAAGRGLPEAYAAASQLLGAAPAGEHPAAQIPPAAADADLRPLLETRAFATWVPERRFMERLVLRLQEIETSQIIVDERQRAEQSAAAIENAIAEYLTPERCAATAQLMLDSAHLLAAGGALEAARLARAAVELYRGPRPALVGHPLPRAFFERLLGRVREAAPAPRVETTGSGLILPGR